MFLNSKIILILILGALEAAQSLSSNKFKLIRRKRQDCGFKCNSGECIEDDKLCDGIVDCRDASDETSENCSKISCPPYLFRCSYGACISKNKVNNGIKDCADNSDESSDGNNPQTACGPSEFKCKNNECINDEAVCDGKPTCKDGSDETKESCSKINCPPYTFRCQYGACIDRKGRCNGVKDCADGSDENLPDCPASLNSPDGATTAPPVKPTATTKSPPTQSTPPWTFNGGCVTPPYPNNGAYVRPDGNVSPENSLIPPNQQIYLKCNEGFRAVPVTLFCIGTDWLPKLPEGELCQDYCPSLADDATITATCRSNNNAEVDCSLAKEGAVAITRCVPYFTYYTNRPKQTCRGGKWSPNLGSCQPECGIKRVNAQALLIGAQSAILNEYPWVVAVYNSSNIHICGGSIISRRYVLSAAHCFADTSGRKRDKSEYTLIAGKYYRDIDHPDDVRKDMQARKIAELHIPDRYTGAITYYQYDIAVVMVQNEFEITHAVQPVCVDWISRFDRDTMVNGTKGVVTGWGYTTEGGLPSEELKKLIVPQLDYPTCKETLPEDFANRYLSVDKICAGYYNQSKSVCSGDSGGGYFFQEPSDKKFYVRAIVSVAPTSTVGCDRNNFALYTLVDKYMDFIKEHTGEYV